MSKLKKPKTGGGTIFFIKEAISNILVNGFMSFAAMSIIAICILIVGCVSLVALNTNKQIADMRDKSQVRIFIDESYARDTYEVLEQKIRAISDVKSLEFLSKEQSLEEFKVQLKEDSSMLDGLEDDNPLRDGYIIYLHSLDNIDAVTQNLNAIEEIDKVASENDIYKALNSLEKWVQIISIVLVIALGGVCIFIIANTVKLAMFSRREEISIMKMIGATDAFIRWPFIIEGLILGIIGSMLAFVAQWFVYAEFLKVSSQYIGFVQIIDFTTIAPYVLYIFLIAGAVIGVLGSVLTIRKFLRV